MYDIIFIGFILGLVALIWRSGWRGGTSEKEQEPEVGEAMVVPEGEEKKEPDISPPVRELVAYLKQSKNRDNSVYKKSDNGYAASASPLTGFYSYVRDNKHGISVQVTEYISIPYGPYSRESKSYWHVECNGMMLTQDEMNFIGREFQREYKRVRNRLALYKTYLMHKEAIQKDKEERERLTKLLTQ